MRWAAGLLILVGMVRLVPSISFQDFHNDFSHYYVGGELYAAGMSPYREALQPHMAAHQFPYDPTIPFAAHPPLIHLIFGGLSTFPPPVAYGIWLVVQLVGCAACLELTRRLAEFRWHQPIWLLLTAVYLNSTCVQALFYHSQIQLVVGSFVLGAIVAKRHGRSGWACGLITLAAMLKIYPAVLFPWCLFGGRSIGEYTKRMSVVLLVFAAAIFVPGAHMWWQFATEGVTVLKDFAIRGGNYSVQSCTHFLATAFNDTFAVKWDTQLTHAPVQAVATCTSILIIAGAYATIWLRRLNASTAGVVLLTAAMCGGIIMWPHYFAILLPLSALLWQQASRLPAGWERSAMFLFGTLLLWPKLDPRLGATFGIARAALHFYPLWTLLAAVALLAKARVPSPLPLRASRPSFTPSCLPTAGQ